MKHCPACRSQYTDLTLRFCLQDGAPLEDAPDARQSTIDTVAFSNPPTAENILKTEELNLYAPPKPAAEKTRAWRPEPPKSALREEAQSSKSSAKIWLAACGALLLFAGAGFGGWFYLKNQNQTAQSFNPENAAPPEIARKTPPADNSASKVVLDELRAPANSNAPKASGAEDVKKEIAAVIELWKKAAEARSVPDFLSRYAEKVDYFDKPGASAAEIRLAAQKTFDAYSEIEITLTNLRVAVDADAMQATAVFDKEWSYETEKDLLESKAHTKLRLQKIGADWKITGEKYQKIYYMEN